MWNLKAAKNEVERTHFFLGANMSCEKKKTNHVMTKIVEIRKKVSPNFKQFTTKFLSVVIV